jgi:PIN domain nuclease of toxin-antitoxin system
MNRYVADTHALIWHLYGNPKLSPAVKAIFERTDVGEDSVIVSAITLVEIIYLTEKQRIPADAAQKVFELLRSGADNYRVAALEVAVAQAVQQVDRALVPELPDRIIAATALHLGLPLICHDRQIESLPGLVIVW